jgi:monovalent cation/hydrogen antiporter
LNGLVFILIGLQLRNVMQGITDYSAPSLMLYGVLISLVVIVVRFVYIVPAVIWPRFFLSRSLKMEKPDTRNTLIFGWAGMRGVVSMAAALAIPLTLPNGAGFPHRNLIIYLSFCVILFTLVLLGFTLPWIIKKLKIQRYSIVAEEYEVRTEVVTSAINYIEENLSLLQDDLLHNIKSKYEVKYNRLQKTDLPANYFGKGTTLAGSIFNEYSKVQIDLINIERRVIDRLHRGGKSSEEILRKIERELDLEESRLQLDMYEG